MSLIEGGEGEENAEFYDTSHLRSATDIFIAISGDDKSLKTTLLNLYLNTFSYENDILTYKLEKPLNIDNESYKVQFMINTGYESYFGSVDPLVRKAQGNVFVYNINSRESFDLYQQTLETINKVKDMEVSPILIIGFGEVKDRKVSIQEGQNAAQSFNCRCKEIHITDDKEELIQQVDDCFTTFIKETLRFYSIREADTSPLSSLTERNFMVLGDSFTGKTSLIKKIVSNIVVHKYTETEKITQYSHKFNDADGPVLLNLFDVPPTVTTYSREFMEKIQGIILVFSISSKGSFEILKDMREKALTAKGVSKIPSIILATKCDLPYRSHQVPQSNIEEFSEKINSSFRLFNREEENNLEEILTILLNDVKKNQSSPIESVADLDFSGQLLKTNKNLKKFKQRYYFIRDGTLFISADGILSPKTPKISLVNDTSVELLPADPAKNIFPFEVRSYGDKPMYISASSENERKTWTDCIIANIAYGQVANSLIDDVVRIMMWETISSIKFSKEEISSLSSSGEGKASGEKHSIWSRPSKSFSSESENKRKIVSPKFSPSEEPTPLSRTCSNDSRVEPAAKLSKKKSLMNSLKLSDRDSIFKKKKKDK